MKTLEQLDKHEALVIPLKNLSAVRRPNTKTVVKRHVSSRMKSQLKKFYATSDRKIVVESSQNKIISRNNLAEIKKNTISQEGAQRCVAQKTP